MSVSSGSGEDELVGLLFVHGIGEQKRFEHLRASVVEFAELMKQSGGDEAFACSVVDRTADWKPDPGVPHPEGLSPVTVTLVSERRRLVFECHEVWWADLGARSGIADSLAFWIWGLGQWCAPIYRDLDVADLAKADHDRSGRQLTKRASVLVKLPEAVAGRLGAECLARGRLALASLATIFVAVGWVVLKRLFSAALRMAPSPTLIVSYVGDVRTYEERAAPGATALSDPGHPRRVGIRRRMVSELVAMGAREDLDRWYVVAHSQGTVLAYNGVTEIGHALPNYLPQAQWDRVPARLRRDRGCDKRPRAEMSDMMPARPGWLAYEDVINRPELFSRLRGMLTYGSPLNKFAAVWPRIVATATDRLPGSADPFGPACRWVNVRALQDPVSGDVTRFFEARKDRPGFKGCLPPIVNVDTPFRPDFLVAHLLYFKVAERFGRGRAVRQRLALMRWLMTADEAAGNGVLANIEQARFPGREPLAALSYLLVMGMLAAAAVAVVTLGGDLLEALFGTPGPMVYRGAGWFLRHAASNAVPLFAAACAALAAVGYLRWIRESRLNWRLAKADGLPRVTLLLASQFASAFAAIGLVGAVGWVAWRSRVMAGATLGESALGGSIALVVVGLFMQALVNWAVATPLRYVKPEPGPDGVPP